MPGIEPLECNAPGIEDDIWTFRHDSDFQILQPGGLRQYWRIAWRFADLTPEVLQVFVHRIDGRLDMRIDSQRAPRFDSGFLRIKRCKAHLIDGLFRNDTSGNDLDRRRSGGRACRTCGTWLKSCPLLRLC